MWDFYVPYVAFVYCLRETNPECCDWNSSGLGLVNYPVADIFRETRNLATVKPSAHFQSGPNLTLSLYPVLSFLKGFVLLFILLLAKAKANLKNQVYGLKHFDKYIHLCNTHHYNQDVEHFHHHQNLPVSLKVSSPTTPHPALRQLLICSLSL